MSIVNNQRENVYALPVWRSWLLFGFIAAGFAALIVRALFLQWWNNDFLREQGDARYSRTIEVSANRGVITDRNGKPLAISTAVESIWAAPEDVKVTPAQLKQLATLLGVDANDLQQKLADTKREFMYLKRQISPEEAAKIMALGIPGISSKREFRRYYPAGETMAHVLGSTNIDDIGQEGLELAMQQRLTGKPGARRVIKDRLGRIIEDVQAVKRPEDGQNIALSIDSNIQNLAFSQLKQAVEANKAKAGAAVVLDAKTGEVLAMATLPSFNPNNRQKVDLARKRNRVITDTFEPGSTLKPFTAAAVLELGLATADTVVQTAPGTMSIGPATIRDAHPGGAMSVTQIIQKSSNIGAAKLALTMKPEQMWNMLHDVGFGSLPHSGFPGEVSGRLRPHKSWVPIEQATMSYGHGISATLLQLARAYGVFATDGRLLPTSLLKLEAPNPGKQVFSPEVALAVRKMLETVTQPGGTALRAQVAGYRVAGKTGTAHKQEGRGYAADKYVASFVGLAPASDPRLIIAVMIDEPSGGQYYGGQVAAPVFASIMSGALRMLSISPDAPSNSILMPPDELEIKEET